MRKSLMLRDRKTDDEDVQWWIKARLMLRQDEGIRHYPYQDTSGVWTIGIGRNLEANPLSIEIIRAMLDEDIERAITGVCNIFTPTVFDSWSDARQHAIVNMVFNLGEAGFREFHRTIEAIKRGDWQAAARHALNSTWAKQVKYRANRIEALLVNEKYHYDF